MITWSIKLCRHLWHYVNSRIWRNLKGHKDWQKWEIWRIAEISGRWENFHFQQEGGLQYDRDINFLGGRLYPSEYYGWSPLHSWLSFGFIQIWYVVVRELVYFTIKRLSLIMTIQISKLVSSISNPKGKFQNVIWRFKISNGRISAEMLCKTFKAKITRTCTENSYCDFPSTTRLRDFPLASLEWFNFKLKSQELSYFTKTLLINPNQSEKFSNFSKKKKMFGKNSNILVYKLTKYQVIFPKYSGYII